MGLTIYITQIARMMVSGAKVENGTRPVGFWEAFWFWVKLGFINFGGPAGQIAIMHRELVERKRWVSEQQYLRTLNFCMLLPGPEAQQVATYISWRGGGDVLVKEALFFTGAAFVTFGEAYAVLGYVGDVAVNDYGWLTADQMVQGLGLAESMPGPLIMVTQYVGFFGASNNPGTLDPLLYGTLGSAITTYATFLPYSMFIFLLAPNIELLANDRRLRAILVGVTAAIVDVIADLAVFFASRVHSSPAASLRADSTSLPLLSLRFRSSSCRGSG